MAAAGALMVTLGTILPLPAIALTPTDQVSITVSGTITGMTTAPQALKPAFSATIHDYTVACRPQTNAVTFNFVGATPASDTVPLGENEAAVISDASNNPYWVRCLPHDFPAVSVSHADLSTAGWYLTGTLTGPCLTTSGPNPCPYQSSPYAMVLDGNGTPVWYQKAPGGALNVKLFSGTHTLAWAPENGPGVGSNASVGYSLFSLDDQSSQPVIFPSWLGATDFHDLVKMANGRWLMIATSLTQGVDLTALINSSWNSTKAGDQHNYSEAQGRIVDCIVGEMDSAGNLVWAWRASNHVDASEASAIAYNVPYQGVTATDLFHCNSVDTDNAGKVLVSLRHADAVFQLSDAAWDPQPDWKLGGLGAAGGDPSPSAKGGEPVIKTFNSDLENGFAGQHDARYEPNGDISLFDNHTIKAGCSLASCAARGVEYSLSLSGTPSATEIFESPGTKPSGCCGSFRRYPVTTDHENLVDWGYSGALAFSMVNDAKTDLFDVSFPQGELTYRAVKVPAAALDVNLLRANAGLPRPLNSRPTWETLPGIYTSKAAAVSWASNRTDLFGRGQDNGLWHAYSDGTTWGLQEIGGPIGGGPAVTSWAPNRLDVFARGGAGQGANQLWTIAWNGTYWQNWYNLGSPPGLSMVGDPGAVSAAPNRIDVFAKMSDGNLWTIAWNGSNWQQWYRLGGPIGGTDPGVSSWTFNRLDVFVHGGSPGDNGLWVKSWNGQVWGDFQPLGANMGELGAGATSSSYQQIDAVTEDGTSFGNVLERLEFTGGTSWMNWEPMFTTASPTLQTAYSPAISHRDSNTEDVFVIATDGSLQHAVLSPAVAGPSLNHAIPFRASPFSRPALP